MIQLLAFVVALEMAVGVVALSARSDRDAVRTTLVAGPVGIPLNDETGTGILAGANLNQRRRSTKASGATAPTGPSSTTSASGVAAPTATSAPPTAISPSATSATSTTAPARPTTTRPGPAGTTATSRSSEAPTTTRPAPSSTTATTGRPPGTTAPPRPTTTTSRAPTAGEPSGDVALADPPGDTFVDGTQTPMKEPRADIVQARATYRPGAIGLLMQLEQPVDPRKDERWASDATFATWSIDTTGDGSADYEIQYYVLDGEIGGVVSPPGSTDVLCDVTGDYSPGGYLAAFDPKCVGDPASFSYRVAMYYDTNPKDDNADVASDVTPNGGWSFAVQRAN